MLSRTACPSLLFEPVYFWFLSSLVSVYYELLSDELF